MGQYTEALIAFDTSVQLCKDNKYPYNLWNNKALSELKLQKYEDAHNSVKKSLEIDDKNCYNLTIRASIINYS